METTIEIFFTTVDEAKKFFLQRGIKVETEMAVILALIRIRQNNRSDLTPPSKNVIKKLLKLEAQGQLLYQRV